MIKQRRVGTMASALMRVHGLSAGRVAGHLGLHRNTLYEKLAGRTAFYEEEIVALADLFRVPVGRLFDDPAELLGVSSISEDGSACIRPFAGHSVFALAA